MCRAILTLGHGSSVGGTAVDLTCLYRDASATKCIAHFSASIKPLNMTSIIRSLCDDMINSCCQSLVCCFSFCTVGSSTCNWPIFSFIKNLIVALSVLCSGMSGLNLPDGTTSRCLPFPRRIFRFLMSISELIIKVERSRLFCFLTPLVFAYYSWYMLRYHTCQNLFWRIVASEIFVCS